MVVLNAMNGLETTLAATIALSLIWCAAQTTTASSLWRLGGLGLLAGLALWARIDTALVILVLLPVALWRLGFWRTVLVAGVAAITVAPWVAYCLLVGGDVIPESGGAVRQIIAREFDRKSLTLWSTLYMSAAAVPRVLFPLFGPLLTTCLTVILLVPPLIAAQKRRINTPAILSLVGLALIVFYAIGLPAFWFFHRYLFLAGLAFVVASVCAVWAATQRWEQMRRMATVGFIAVMTGQVLAHVPSVPVLTGQSDAIMSGQGYGRVARALVADVPDGSVLTAMQSGALGWFAPAGVRVVNLDGVVNGAAKDAIHDETLDRYMQSVGATHFADWQSFVNWMQLVSADPVRLTKIAAFADHAAAGVDFTLYRIDWP